MKLGARLRRLDERGLRLLFVALFVAFAIPAVVLVAQAYDQLKWESFRTAQLAADELAARIDARLREAVATEDARAAGDYAFLVVEGDAAANFVQRSPLSAFPVAGAVPGVLGYFQVDAQGRLTTPLLPEPGVAAAGYGIGAEEEAQRAALVARLRDVLAANRLARVPERAARAPAEDAARETSAGDDGERDAAAKQEAADAPAEAEAAAGGGRGEARLAEPAAQAAFDELVAAPVAPFASRSQAPAALANEASRLMPGTERRARVEQSVVPAAAPQAAPAAPPAVGAEASRADARVLTFESEVEPFTVAMLDTQHLVMFRNVYRGGERLVQGALLDADAFLAGAVEAPLRASAVGRRGSVAVLFNGAEIGALASGGEAGRYPSGGTRELAGTVLQRARLSPPFGSVELVFAAGELPPAPGAALLAWVAVALAVVLSGGFWLMYRLAAGQMRLARQQQDFVSAVSHELKTPLTSIRLYGEMLQAGWADEAKKQTYYAYIHGESERLSRLIDNVLTLARLTRSSLRLERKRVTVAELLDLVSSKVATQVERAGFGLALRNDAPAAAALEVDADSFVQIFINLVDNALKFAAAAPVKRVEIGCRRESDGRVLFTVRDFGPGVPKEQMKRIFELFYRAENELTRETVGTGIGLALVRQLATAMGGRVDVRNCEPGAEFRLTFAVS